MSNSVVWFEVLGQDADKMRAFYSSLLGWKFNLDPETKYGIVEVGGGIAGGVGQAPPGQRGWITFYTQVPDLEAAVQHAQELGSAVLMPINELPDTRIAVVNDPEGHPVGLCTPRA
jgi:hypothetical protein